MKAVENCPGFKVMSHAYVLGRDLGVSEREMTRAALAIVIQNAEKHGDPDGYVAKLLGTVKKADR